MARFQISSTELGICSLGACITTTTEPTMHDTQPRTPSFSSRSLSTKCANTELTIMLNAPRGVTSIAGAKT
uniref:Uncharacterized protein n=1 Tax=Arundo donax TaxID=35708 RepID=A0A0A9EDN0_ARUDO